MKTKLCRFTGFCFCALMTIVSSAQPSTIIWQKTIGGNDVDSVTAMTVVKNNSFVMCGASKSKKEGNKSDRNYGGYDYWLVKMDVSGNIIWNKTFGGASDDIATAIIATSDGGYLVGGTSLSNQSVTKSKVSYKNSADFWVIKLDVNGNKTWDKTIGGIFTDNLTSVAELSAGKYAVGGYSFSDNTGAKTIANIGAENTADYWMLILDSKGNIQSQSTFGGTSMDVLACIAPSGTTSVYLGGYSYSLKYSGYKTVLPNGNNDFWVIKSDLAGHIQNELGFGGSLSDYLTCMQVLPDNSLIFGGYSNSPASGTRTDSFFGNTDYWTIKTKANGTKEWDKAFGAAGTDHLLTVQQTKDKGFILAGYSNSNAGSTKTQNSKGGYDYWIVKVNAAGVKQWDKTFGGGSDDRLAGIYEIDTGQFILAGSSSSPVSGDKAAGTVGNTGAPDYWVMKIAVAGGVNKTVSPPVTLLAFSNNIPSLIITPNPVKDVLTVQYKTATSSKVNVVGYAANGNAVLKAVLPSAPTISTHSFDVAHLSKGVYRMVMYDGDKKVSKMFVKE